MKFIRGLSARQLFGTAAVIALVAWIGWAGLQKYRETVDPEPVRAASPIPVRVETVTPGPFSAERNWRGSIDVDERATLSAQVTATVVELPVREGDRVAAGDRVYRLDDAEQRAELARLEAVIERISGELENARRELTRQRELFARELTPEKLLDDSAQRVDSLSAQLREAEANRTLVQTRLDYTTGVAPFSGSIQRLHVQRGELARAGSPVIELVADDALKAVAQVAQKDIRHIRPEMAVTVVVPALDREWKGQVDRIYPALDKATRNATISILLPEQAAGVRVGMAAVVHARLGAWDAALTLPAQAVHGEYGANWIFVRDGDRAQRRSIRAGARHDGRVHIEAGLEKGEQVIVTADPRLKDGVRIDAQSDGPTS